MVIKLTHCLFSEESSRDKQHPSEISCGTNTQKVKYSANPDAVGYSPQNFLKKQCRVRKTFRDKHEYPIIYCLPECAQEKSNISNINYS